MNDDEQLHPEEDKQEYEAQLFGFTAFSVIDKVYDSKITLLDEAVMLMYRMLKKKYENVGSDVIRKGCEGLRDDILKSLDKICDKLEVYLLTNILCIPKTVLLPEDAVHQDDKLQGIDESVLNEDIDTLKAQIRDVTDSISNGCRERAMLESSQDKYQTVLDMLNDMETCFKDVGLQQLDEDIATIKADAANLLDKINSLESMELDWSL